MDILTTITSRIDDFIFGRASDLFASFFTYIGPFVTLYLLIVLLKAAVDQRDIKEPALVVIKFAFFCSLAVTNYHIQWIALPILETRDSLIEFFIGSDVSIWESTITAVDEGKKIMSSNSGWFGDFGATLFGIGLILVYAICYAVYASIYIVNYFVFGFSILFSGILIVLSSMAIFSGLIKAWFQMMFSSSLNIVFVSLLMILSISISKTLLIDVGSTNGGARYFAAFIMPLITIYLMPHVSALTSSITGGSSQDFRAEVGNVLNVGKAALGKAMKKK